MRQNPYWQGLRKTFICGGLAALFGVQTFGIATPSYAFLFFHKHKKDNNQSNQSGSYPSSYPPSQTVIYGPGGYGPPGTYGSRLVPSYLYNNSAAANENNNVSPRQNVLPQKTGSIAEETEAPSLVPVNHTIRVGIGLNLEKAKISILDGAQVIDNNNGQVIANLPGQSQWLIERQDDQLVLEPRLEYYNGIEKLALDCEGGAPQATIEPAAYYPGAASTNADINQDLSIVTPKSLPANVTSLQLPLIDGRFNYIIKSVARNGKDKSGLLALNDRPYRGDFLIQNNKEKFNVINVLNLEDYLLAVVPSEMPSLWPDEALKAQAIAARSYAVANLGKHANDGYDVKDNTEDQMYLGIKAETEFTNQAVNSTNGLVIKYDGKPICAYFHSASGGSTEAAENVWQKPLPYLKAVTDFDQESPMYNWTRNFTVEQAQSAIPADKDIGELTSIEVSEKSPAGRATRLLIAGSKNDCVISGEAARKYFKLPSTNFNVTPLENAYIFTGKGFGHGLGLSQWGAKSLASHGYNAAQILCYYYNDVNIGY